MRINAKVPASRGALNRAVLPCRHPGMDGGAGLAAGACAHRSHRALSAAPRRRERRRRAHATARRGPRVWRRRQRRTLLQRSNQRVDSLACEAELGGGKGGNAPPFSCLAAATAKDTSSAISSACRVLDRGRAVPEESLALDVGRGACA